MSELFAEVILPLSLHDSFTYKIPESLKSTVQPGVRVVVQFGQRKYYAALVTAITDSKPDLSDLKEIIQVLDETPIVLPQNLDLWRWIATYYCSTLGDVFRAALPSGLKMESKISSQQKKFYFLSHQAVQLLKN